MTSSIGRLLDSTAYAPNIYALPLAITCALLFGMAAFVLAKRRTAVHVCFGVLVSSAFVWLSGHVLLNLTTDPDVALSWSRYKYLGVTTLGANFYLFTVAYVGRLRQARRSLVASYALSALFLVLAWLPADQPGALISGVKRFYWGYYAQLSPLIGVAYLGMFVLQSAAAFYQVVAARMTCRDAAERKRNDLLLASFGGGYLASLDFVPCFGVSIYPAGYLFITAFLALIAYSIVRYNLLDLVTVIQRTGIWLLTSLLVRVPLTAGLVWAEPWLRTASPLSFMAAHLAIFALMFLYVKHVQPRIDQAFQRRRYDVLRVIQDLDAEIRDLHEIQPLARRIVGTVERVFRPLRAALVLLPAAPGTVPEEHEGDRPGGIDASGRDADFLAWLRIRNEVIDRDRLSGLGLPAGEEAEARVYFDRHEIQLVVPMVQHGALVAVLHLGAKSGGRAYGAWDLHLLASLQSTVSIALGNSLLYEQVQRLNRRLTETIADLASSNRVLQGRNEELRRTRQQLVQSTRLAAVGEMSAKLAHELGNPIGIISGSVQFCLHSLPLPDEVRQHLEVTARHAQSAGRIVRGLLHLARPEDAAPQPIALPEVIEQVCTLLGGRCNERGVRMETDFPIDLPTVLAARGHLDQVLLNLLLNAIEAVPDHGWIRVTGRPDASGTRLMIAVTDSGPGVPAENLERIFEPFFSTRAGGTGLGLAICRDITTLYGGTIHAEGESGATRFVIHLPAAEPVGREPRRSPSPSLPRLPPTPRI